MAAARPRLVVAALAATLLAATSACASGGGGTAVGTRAPSSTSSTVPAGGSAPTLTGTGHSSSPDTTAPTRSSGHPQASAPTVPPAPAPATSTALIDAAHGPVGAFSPYVLRPRPAGRIVVELQEQGGATPSQQAIDHTTSVLRSVSSKDVAVTAPVRLAGSARSWDEGTISALADSSTRQSQGGGQAVIHLLYLHGTFKGDSSVLGVAVRGDVLALFVDQLQSSASITLPESELEDVVTMHETGHILGLVDLYLHTGRQDPQHPGHSTDRHSVMYWAVDSSLIGQILGGNPPKDFDSDDLHDLQTIRSTT